MAAELEQRSKNMNADRYDKLVDRVRERCSFHLFAAMPEAYFFRPWSDEAIGCTRAAILVPGRDVEDFETIDARSTSPPPPRHRLPGPSTWHFVHTIRKRYLQFLLRPAAYNETNEGVEGISALDWRRVQRSPTRRVFSRSLFQDVAQRARAGPVAVSGASTPVNRQLSEPRPDPPKLLRVTIVELR